MDTKLRIDISQGTLEVEGSEEFVREIYGDFKDKLYTLAQAAQNNIKKAEKSKTPSPPSAKRRPRITKETHTIVKEIDLAAKDDRPSLKDYFATYKVANNFERNLVFVYYLQTIAKVSPITSDHIFTCYKHVQAKVPVALSQSLWDVSSKKGWIDTSSLGNIKLTTQGTNYIEYDMTKVG